MCRSDLKLALQCEFSLWCQNNDKFFQETKNRELETVEADRVVAESRLQLEIGTLSENLNSTRAEWVACTQKIDAMGRDNDELKGQIIVLNVGGLFSIAMYEFFIPYFR